VNGVPSESHNFETWNYFNIKRRRFCNRQHKFFDLLGILYQFFNKDVGHWHNDKDYKKSIAIVLSMRVVNDISERGVAGRI